MFFWEPSLLHTKHKSFLSKFFTHMKGALPSDIFTEIKLWAFDKINQTLCGKHQNHSSKQTASQLFSLLHVIQLACIPFESHCSYIIGMVQKNTQLCLE